MIEILLQAERALSVGLLDRAETLYRQVAKADPKNSIAVVGLARVTLDRGDDVGALKLARKALAIDPENVAAQRMVSRLEEVLEYRDAQALLETGESKAPEAKSVAETQGRDAQAGPRVAEAAVAQPEPAAEPEPEPAAEAEPEPAAEAEPEPAAGRSRSRRPGRSRSRNRGRAGRAPSRARAEPEPEPASRAGTRGRAGTRRSRAGAGTPPPSRTRSPRCRAGTRRSRSRRAGTARARAEPGAAEPVAEPEPEPAAAEPDAAAEPTPSGRLDSRPRLAARRRCPAVGAHRGGLPQSPNPQRRTPTRRSPARTSSPRRTGTGQRNRRPSLADRSGTGSCVVAESPGAALCRMIVGYAGAARLDR